MKLIIKIAQEAYNNLKIGCTQRVSNCEMIEAIKNGTPIPDNATNGDVIKAMFPNLEWIGSDKDVDFYYLDRDLPYAPKFSTFRSWWNAPYQKGGKE